MIAIDVFFLLVLVGGGVAFTSWLSGRRREALAARIPPGLRASSAAELRQAGDYYRLCRRMAHIIEGVLIHDGTVPILNERMRKDCESVMEEWQKL